MFEDYLEDSYYFMKKAERMTDSRDAKRHYRVSVFCGISAIEAFVNFVGDAFSNSGKLKPYEVAFLTDKPFSLVHGRFEILEKSEYHTLEDKLRFLISRYVPKFDYEKTPCWARLFEFKKFRDSLIHPRQDEDETDLDKYKAITAMGVSSVIEIMNYLCLGIFNKPLRKKLLDLKVP